MTKQERYHFIIDWFEKNRPIAESELDYKDPFGLLVAVILSAQCTDKRVNMVTPSLLEAYPDAATMSLALPEDIFSYIRSISYPNNKAKHLVGMAKILLENFQGTVPSEVDELQTLPGVGRKTANVIASIIFNKPTMAVDTHVFRVSNRIGLSTNCTTPLAVEKQLTKFIPKEIIPKAHHWLILHGRYVCTARKPHCEQCGLQPCCKFFRSTIKSTI